MDRANPGIPSARDIAEVSLDAAARVVGDFSWQGAAFCGACALEGGAVMAAVAFVAGGVLLD